MSSFAWVTLATNDSYSLGALVVANSLKRVGTQHKLAVLITSGVSESMKSRLQETFDVVQSVNVLDSKDAANLAVLKRPELGITFTKLHCWNLTQFDKCVFLDADVLILQNCDELFEREEFSASPDVGWPDCFNSGVFVFKPSVETFGKLVEFADKVGSFDGGDQGLLNQFFNNWSTGDSSKRLPFSYNTASTATYSYMPAFKHFNKDIKILHFIGETKPWNQRFNTTTRHVDTPFGYSHLQNFFQFWWDIFCENVHPTLTADMSGLAGALAQLTLGAPLSSEQAAYENNLRRANWEAGQIDYLGQDSFDNILKKIQQTLEDPPAQVVEERERKRSVTPQRKSKSPEPAPAVVEPTQPKVEVVTEVKAPVQESTQPPQVEPVVAQVSIEIKATEEPKPTVEPEQPKTAEVSIEIKAPETPQESQAQAVEVSVETKPSESEPKPPESEKKKEGSKAKKDN